MIFNNVTAAVLTALCSVGFQGPQPTGDWFGILKIKPITYLLYLKHSGTRSQLFILNPKANEIPLDTLYFKGDSLRFNREDFFSEFKGAYQSASNTIQGLWTDDGHKDHPVTFVPVDPDTLSGLRPRTTEDLTWQSPQQKDDGLKTCERPEGVDPRRLDSLSISIIREKFPNIHSLLIAKDGCLFYEDYFYGWKPDDLWLIQSVTKSFTSALIGVSLSKGEIRNLDEPICKYFKNYKEKACNAENSSITIRNLLSMTTGLEWNELEFDYYDERNTANECGKAPDPFECVLSRARAKPGEVHFAYNSMNHLMANIVLRKSKSTRNAKELRQRILDPLGITEVNLGKENFGVIGDIGMTPRSMLKFGMLYVNNGVWNGKSIIPSSWVGESTSTHVKIGDREGYGYFWWTKQFKVNGQPVECFYAWGYGGQYIFVVPTRKLVVCITASNWIMDEKKYAFEMMQNYILPATGI